MIAKVKVRFPWLEFVACYTLWCTCYRPVNQRHVRGGLVHKLCSTSRQGTCLSREVGQEFSTASYLEEKRML